MTEADAQKAAIESMADADFLGIKFDQIHTPKMKWWHYAILVIVLISVVVAAIIYVNWYTQKVHDNNKDVSPDKQISQYYEQHGKENNYETGS
jgi:flagellar biosynthesis/type III secretory pathway M-ring protein FliF/YscJ